jgi:hypoxanthine phosphoribosyltransferase
MRDHEIDEILFTSEDIHARNMALVKEIAVDNSGAELVLIGILRGSFIFLADLVRLLFSEGVHPRIDFMTMESYVGTESSGRVKIAKEFDIDVAGANVIVIDDILDTGRTLQRAVRHIRAKGAAAVKTCVLLDKPERRAVEYQADYVGFRIENHFVIGYGLDYDGLFRELPYIARLKSSADS